MGWNMFGYVIDIGGRNSEITTPPVDHYTVVLYNGYLSWVCEVLTSLCSYVLKGQRGY